MADFTRPDVVHLLRRAGFGKRPGQFGQLVGNSPGRQDNLFGLRAFGAFLPLGQAGKQPALGAFGPGNARAKQRGPWPAQAHQRLQCAPCPLALGPVGGLAGFEQTGGGALSAVMVYLELKGVCGGCAAVGLEVNTWMSMAAVVISMSGVVAVVVREVVARRRGAAVMPLPDLAF